jgi:TonB family protein
MLHRVILVFAVAAAAGAHVLIAALPASQDFADPSPRAEMAVSYAGTAGAERIAANRTTAQTGRTATTTQTRPNTLPSRTASTSTGTSTSTVTGTGTNAGSAASIRAAFLQKIESMKTYPALARASGIQGSVRLRVILDEQGNLASMTVLQTSGNYMLDEAAEKLVRNALPFQHHTPSFTCEFSVAYRLSDPK